MGGGTYSVTNSVSRTMEDYSMFDKSRGIHVLKSKDEIFTQKSINNAMNPYGIVVRESRDSEEHPNSLAIILALDVTGSMGSVPHHLITTGLPTLMGEILEKGIQDPQVLFMGIGDHECDQSPLQVAQFESSDDLLDKWLKDVYLEGGGGANYGESYSLAWYLAGYHTAIDCFEKRGEKGFLFTVGDEPVLKKISKSKIKDIMGDGQYEDFTHDSLLKKAMEKYNVYHLHIKETAAGSRKEVIDGWKQILHENLIVVENHAELATTIADIIIKNTSVKPEQKVDVKIDIKIEKPEIIL
jgi:hypothetical protein